MIINSTWLLQDLLGSGENGSVYRGINIIDISDDPVAIKISSEDQYDSLETEYKIYSLLGTVPKDEGTFEIPKIRWFGKENGRNVLVLELCGKSLHSIREGIERFSIRTTLLTIDRHFSTVIWLMKHNIYHQDISKGNILSGLGQDRFSLYLVDFGFSRILRIKEDAEDLAKLPHHSEIHEDDSSYPSELCHLYELQRIAVLSKTMLGLDLRPFDEITTEDCLETTISREEHTNLCTVYTAIQSVNDCIVSYTGCGSNVPPPNYGVLRENFRRVFRSLCFKGNKIQSWE